MRIIRTDLATGDVTEVARYTEITTTTAHHFMAGAAQREAESRKDIRHTAVTPDILSGRSVAVLVDLQGRSVVEFSQEWPVEDDGEQ